MKNTVDLGSARLGDALGPSVFAGIPGARIEDVTVRDLHIPSATEGKGDRQSKPIPQREPAYPNQPMFGNVPAHAFSLRHVKGVRFVDIAVTPKFPGGFPDFVSDRDTDDVTVEGAQRFTDRNALTTLKAKRLRGSQPSRRSAAWDGRRRTTFRRVWRGSAQNSDGGVKFSAAARKVSCVAGWPRENGMIDDRLFVTTLLAERVNALAYISSIVRRPDLAEDVFQEVCVIAIEKRAEIESDLHLRRWMRTTARLQALKILRERRQNQVVLDEATLNAVEQDWQDLEDEELASYVQHLRRCKSLLSKAHRELLSRRFSDGCDYSSLALEHGRSVNSLYVTFSRIYSFLGKCIADGMASGTRAQRV